jgi:GNAT superfamily N-acetyltransferase
MIPDMRGEFSIRPAAKEDIAAVHTMIRELAVYENLAHLCVATETDLHDALWGPHAAAEVLVAWKADAPAGFALFFHNYSTFLGRRGIWLEDLFVRPACRRQGCAGRLLRAVATLAIERNCGRFEWSVLDWNAGAIDFYRGLGATILPDWRIVRLVGPALAALAIDSPVDTLPGVDAIS